MSAFSDLPGDAKRNFRERFDKAVGGTRCEVSPEEAFAWGYRYGKSFADLGTAAMRQPTTAVAKFIATKNGTERVK